MGEPEQHGPSDSLLASWYLAARKVRNAAGWMDSAGAMIGIIAAAGIAVAALAATRDEMVVAGTIGTGAVVALVSTAVLLGGSALLEAQAARLEIAIGSAIAEYGEESR